MFSTIYLDCGNANFIFDLFIFVGWGMSVFGRKLQCETRQTLRFYKRYFQLFELFEVFRNCVSAIIRSFVRSLSFFLCQRQDMQMHARLNNKGKGFNFLLLYFWYGKKKKWNLYAAKEKENTGEQNPPIGFMRIKSYDGKKTLVLKNLLICQRLFFSIFSRWFFKFDSVWRTVQIEIK